MPLSILLPLVVFGITGIVLLVHLTGNSRRLTFKTPDQAITHWHRQFPDVPAQAAHLSDDGHVALIETIGMAGLVWSMGADSTARRLTPDCNMTPSPLGLRVRFHDFTAPALKINISSAFDQKDWIARATRRAEGTQK